MQVSGLWVYPIKSCRGVPVASWRVERRGLDEDRRWMLVDARGKFVTQREEPRLAPVSVTFDGGALAVSAPGRDGIEVPRRIDQGSRIQVTIWRSSCEALVFDPGSRWFSELLDTEVRLVHMPDDVERAVNPDYGRAGDVVSFADGFPVLLVSEESLAGLNARLGVPVEMRRFRPNLVVKGASPHAEDEWRRFRVGLVRFRGAKPSSRCVLTTRDPDTGVAGKEPLATLSSYRARDGQVYFGMNVTPDSTGELHVGDELSVEP